MADTFIVIGTGPAVNVVLGGAGASAYQIWLDAGNTGTEQDFLDSLEGPQGPAGATGATGATGPQGPPGDDAPVQTLSIDGNDLTLSDGGGTVTIPGGASDALGTGFTAGGGSGSIPAETIAKLTSGSFFSFQWSNDGDAVAMYDDEGSVYFTSKNGSNTTQTGNSGWATSTPSHSISIQDIGGVGNPDDGVFTITDNTSTPLGLRYAADYSATIVTNPTSFTDVTSVNLLKQTPVSYTNAAAPNNTIFYSTTDSKLSYKDSGGVVHGLY